MTKELEREAKDYANDWLGEVHELELKHRTDSKPEYIRIQQAYLAGAEPREKRIAELEKEKTDLVQEKNNLEYKIENLKNKVEHHQEVIDTLQKKLERNCTPEEICMKLEERIHTLEVYLEGAINFLILNGDVDNPIIKSVENILHITFNKNIIY